MTDVLYICASPRGEQSAAVQAANVFTDALADSVSLTELNLFTCNLPEYTSVLTNAKQKIMTAAELSPDEANEWTRVTELVDQFLNADHVLIALPMWNFSIPYKFKQYIDLLTHPGLTFQIDKDGPRGIGAASGTVIYSRGGDYSPKDGQPDPFDFQSPYVKAWAALVGISPLNEVLVQGTLAGPDAQAEAIARASQNLKELAARV